MNNLPQKGGRFAKPTVRNNNSDSISIIAADTRIEGNISSKSELDVHGLVDGKITTKGLYLAPRSICSGTINSEKTTVSGKFEGEISSSHVEVKSTAKIAGQITQKTITVEAGAELDVKIQTLK